jgi:nucleoside 2-deoxyribosyltransferase
MRIYLSGPMSGLPNFNREQFNAVANVLRSRGFDVFNPAEQRVSGDDWTLYMRKDICGLMACDIDVLLPNWDTSRGAMIETFLASVLGIPMYIWSWSDMKMFPAEINITSVLESLGTSLDSLLTLTERNRRWEVTRHG